MNINLDDDLKICAMCNYLLGKSIWHIVKNKKTAPILFKDFCASRKPSNSFYLKYCKGLKAKDIVVIEHFSEERAVYKQIDSDMRSFGAYLANECPEAEEFKKIRERLYIAILSEYNKREVAAINSKNKKDRAWKQLCSDCIKSLT